MKRQLLLVWLVSGILRPASAVAPDGYHDYTSLSRDLSDLVRARPRLAQLESIGKSFEGRDLWVVTLGKTEPGKPAIYLDAAHDGADVVASEVAFRALAYLLEEFTPDSLVDLVSRVTLHVLPRANPDAVERGFAEPPRRQHALLRPFDDDKDELLDEDGPEDINGDGAITMMRVPDPAGDRIADGADPRLMVARKAGDEGRFYRLYCEGNDTDGDGLVGEDPEGGSWLVHNFPQGWEMEQLQPGAGPYAASELETIALLEFFVAHPEIAAVVTLGQGDRPERAGAGKGDLVPKADAAVFEALDTLVEKVRGRKLQTDYEPSGETAFGGAGQLLPTASRNAPAPKAPRAIVPGAFVDWAYFQTGAWALSPQVWAHPPHVETAAADSAEDTLRKETRDPVGLAWLEWIDAKATGGFVPWRPYEHPTLGTVEIGGFRQSPRYLAPAAALDSLGAQTARLIVRLASRMPSLAIADLQAMPLSDGLYRIQLTVENTGRLPTLSAQADTADIYHPVLAEVRLPERSAFVGSPDRVKLGNLGPGERRTAEWLVRSSPGEAILVRVWSVRGGSASKTVTLSDTPRRD